MPIHDYECEVCKTVAPDVYISTQNADAPKCPACEGNPPMSRMWTTSRQRIFQAFDFTGDDGKTVTVDSLARLRKIESESMKAYERGEGRPFIFRQYSQDPTNKDKGIFSHLQPKQIDPRKARTMAAAMEFGTFDEAPEFHPATLRAMESQGRNRSRSR